MTNVIIIIIFIIIAGIYLVNVNIKNTKRWSESFQSQN